MTQKEIKKNRTQAAIQKMATAAYDPMQALIDIAQNPSTPLDTKIDCHKTLIKYIYPTLKHVEMDAQIKSDLIVQVKQFVKPEKVIQIESARHDKLPGQGISLGYLKGDTDEQGTEHRHVIAD
jgi:hypothetical protein